ncbi:E3 ubiquitin-protein ligase DTX4-like [Erpetoichthys calabaricus]|uniref:E3 ubiquitin-protein ligase n=1 Tax=Erpetoichthys calabaricus TaxID=27687 RepID=A0A8C4RZZ4_ERPCA|nr:E3 ubiquitin-protein ligase DTX4-like [Erpetoichthys calabaricus]
MLMASAVVVWEWLNEHGRWRPYSPAVSHHIEAVIRANPRGGSVVLGQVDSKLSPYIIDLQSMHQFRQDTGTLRPVRRSFYDPTSAPGKGVVWEWENDSGSWTPYDMEICITIQAARDRQQPWLDLTPIGFCYIIDFTSMSQINRQTQRRRRIQRRLDLTYPLVTGALPKSQSWPAGAGAANSSVTSASSTGINSLSTSIVAAASAPPPGQPCNCQQCMLVMSVKATAAAAAAAASSTLSPQNRKGKQAAPPPATVTRSPPNTKSGSPGAKPSQISVNSATSSSAPVLSSAGVASPRVTVSSASTGTIARSSLANLSRPTLQRIAMAQSRALIASGVPTVPVKNLNGSSPVHPALAGITGILMSAAGLPVCLTRPPKLVLHPPPVSKSDIKPIPGIGNSCRKTTKKQARKGKTPEEVVRKYLQKVRNPPEEDCTICMEPLASPSGYKSAQGQPPVKPDLVGKLTKCGHIYHLHCLVAMYNNGNKDGSLQCPTCKTIYGVKTGTQPPGKMEYHIIPHSLPGHPDCRTIRIIYNIPPGIQGPEHPNPGKPFTARGFPRHCYLPDSEKGRKVLKLLLVAWDRRLIFTIGTSSTTGESDTVIWNEVHHKTEFGSNLTGHGFPDPNYLDNVLAELTAQGITEESLRD